MISRGKAQKQASRTARLSAALARESQAPQGAGARPVGGPAGRRGAAGGGKGSNPRS